MFKKPSFALCVSRTANARKFFSVFIALLLGLSSGTIANALSFQDNFDDGNANGWWLGYNCEGIYGDWRAASGTLAQYSSRDHYVALAENLLVSTQVIETRVRTVGYGGVVLWYQDTSNWVSVSVYPAGAGIRVTQFIDGVEQYYWHGPWASTENWYDLRVDADSLTGNLAIYLDDAYLFSYLTSTPYRTGMSGLISGNAVSYFDDFRLTSDANPVPEPSTLLLLSSGLVGLVGWRRRRK